MINPFKHPGTGANDDDDLPGEMLFTSKSVQKQGDRASQRVDVVEADRAEGVRQDNITEYLRSLGWWRAAANGDVRKMKLILAKKKMSRLPLP